MCARPAAAASGRPADPAQSRTSTARSTSRTGSGTLVRACSHPARAPADARAVGPIVGGQVYEKAPHGWAAICYINLGLFGAAGVLAAGFAGADPLWHRVRRRMRGVPSNEAPALV
jgi:hypothetical protein